LQWNLASAKDLVLDEINMVINSIEYFQNKLQIKIQNGDTIDTALSHHSDALENCLYNLRNM
jgi:dsRNA-specific ribonuclease